MNWRLEINNLSVGYGDKVLLGGLSLRVRPGECILLCGPNGSGKSTLLKTLAGLLPPVCGSLKSTVQDDGSPSAAGTPNVVMVPTRIPKIGGFSVKEFVATSCYKDSDWLGRLPSDRRKKVNAALEQIGIPELADRDISTLSDGEFQKACIAVSLVRDADMILLDEPTAFLDPDARTNVLSTLNSLSASDRTVIFSSHDIAESMPMCSRIWGIASSRNLSSYDPCVQEHLTVQNVPGIKNILLDTGESATTNKKQEVLASCFSSFR